MCLAQFSYNNSAKAALQNQYCEEEMFSFFLLFFPTPIPPHSISGIFIIAMPSYLCISYSSSMPVTANSCSPKSWLLQDEAQLETLATENIQNYSIFFPLCSYYPASWSWHIFCVASSSKLNLEQSVFRCCEGISLDTVVSRWNIPLAQYSHLLWPAWIDLNHQL